MDKSLVSCFLLDHGVDNFNMAEYQVYIKPIWIN